VPAPKTRPGIVPMELWQLGNASAVYGFGFLVLFAVFALLYYRAYARRRELQLTDRDIFRLRTEIGHHLTSAAVGGVATLWALAAPLRLAFMSPMLFALMGPAHFWWGTRRSRFERAHFHSETTDAREEKQLV